ncbi:phenylacetate--CoA ligase family protein [Natronomonas sp. CBA1123]|uniref:phenylacetate--CoA ligase family protein n=1 Tax=Natronomonas sp. CBA1123 TaxID=2668070 RepID=UPI0012EA53C1|nr:phenylacetate--CoA ligase family protein [Natronomonas sp. CBA1123]MUV85646.1 phenylacetate--CoA ligase family protein [Natronomonas sp. CBA1123]
MDDEETLAAVNEQLERVGDYELYDDLGPVDSWEAFRELPFLTGKDLKADYDDHAPEGSLYDGAAMMCFTPLGDDLAPVFDTTADLEWQAEANARAFERAGIEAGDRVLNTFGYHTFGTGIIVQRGLEALGAEVIPAGPGESEQAAATVSEFDVDALVGNPSFALKVGDAGASVDTFVGAGEPFTSIPGMREQVKDALGADTAVDYFGTRQILPVAAETENEDGLYLLDDYALVEVVDPDTGELLPFGERGELVVTHLKKEGCPLVRYRTGDLAEWEQRDGEIVLPDGVIGRTDGRLKVKGVKLYPESLGTVLAGFDGLTGEFRLEVSRPESTDQIRLVVEGDADIDELAAAVKDRLLVAPNEVELVDDIDETGVVDERY